MPRYWRNTSWLAESTSYRRGRSRTPTAVARADVLEERPAVERVWMQPDESHAQPMMKTTTTQSFSIPGTEVPLPLRWRATSILDQ
ncbi:hypothetical protein N7519_005730 [Penicillium mononematosum]|uniref:uncharacterized protein n=1 Tax=Penicillium mononematosum TaxID=268346 RepID=UPI0025490680|nr:uncharacterized protein N7519_005730 [Penicillium mononematosum]KAJ6184429.1 hypothetical protein N7519_005730 [Penicillium mononematosum]